MDILDSPLSGRTVRRRGLLSAAALSAVLAVALCSGLIIGGCGGDTARAREYMTEADNAAAEVNAQGLELQRVQTGGVSAIISGDPARILAQEAVIMGLYESLEEYKKSINDAIALYKKIDGLKGVAEYKTYSKMMQAALKTRLESVNAGAEILDESKAMFEAVKAGQPAPSVQAAMLEDIQRALDLKEKSSRQEREAAQYQQEHNLKG